MKIDFSTPIKDLEGNPVKITGDKEFTIGDAAVTVLMATFQDEQNLDPQEKLRRFKLALIASNKESPVQEIPVTDIAYIKGLIGKGMSPLIVGRAEEIFEGAVN